MKRNLTLVLLITLFVNSMARGQQTNNWYFGSAAGFANTGLRVDFTSGSPVVSTCYPLMTEEGSSSISDASGNPIFYTDGTKVWDGSTNTTVIGGTGLLGNSSTTQSAVVMPVSTSKWLIFTSGVTGAGLNYYTVTSSPLTVSSGTNLVGAGTVGEGLTIIGSTKGGSSAYWVIVRDQGATGQVRAFEVDNTGGVNATAVTSIMSNTVGYTHTSYTSKIGSIKANTCQNQLAFTYLNGNTDITGFNTATGQVIANTAKNIPVASSGGNSGSYGIEFSPNDKYLYISNLSGANVYQYDIALNAVALLGTLTGEAGQMQLGPDGVIYMAHNNVSPSTPPSYLSTITNPDSATPTFSANSLLLSGVKCGINSGFSYRGLPTFPKSLTVTNPVITKPDTTVCQGASVSFNALYAGSIGAGATDYQWTFVDPATTTSTSKTPSHTYPTLGGPYKVKLYITDVCGRIWKDSMYVTVVAPKTPAGSITCSGNNLILDNPAVDADEPKYVWYKNSVAAGNIIGTGTPVTYAVGSNSAMPTNICVAVANSVPVVTSGSGTVSSAAADLTSAWSWAANGPSYTSPLFDVLTDNLTLKSFDVRIWAGCNTNVTVTIKKGATTVYTQSIPLGATCGTSNTISINTTLQKGTGYTISLAGSATYYGGTVGGTNAQITYGSGTSESITNLVYDYKNYTYSLYCGSACYAVGCTLPVELSYFEASRENGKVLLSWITQQERNNDHFNIERSTDGENFEVIGTVKGKGNASQLSYYNFTDLRALNQITYYRLAQYDIDGTREVGPVRVVLASEKEEVIVYPNPSANQFKVIVPSSDGSVLSVTDILGREIFTKVLNESEVVLELEANWPAGHYILRWTTEQDTKTVHLVKE